MFSKTSIVALLAASASAAALPAAPDLWLWHLTGATSICTAATCRYKFNVSAPAGPSDQPGFTAAGCYGTSVQGDFKSCDSVEIGARGDVLAQEFNLGVNTDAIWSVRFTFSVDDGRNGATYWYTGNGTIAHGGAPVDLYITPTEAWGIA